ncbi:hypothetical protein EC991_006173 [Linnemannia zychae]|nr:hypothetical protein EC991_006173 [Linnemannia zychae]
MGGIVPKFNTIKLDLKSVTNHPEESRHLYRSQQYQQQQQQQPQQPQPRRFSSPGAHGNENEDVEIKGSRSARQGSPSPYPYHHYQQQQQQQQQHRYSSGSIHSGFKSEEHEDGDDVERERLTLRRRGSELDRKPLPVSTVTGHERPNPNPNGESPVLTPRGPVGALHVNEGDMEEEKDNGRGGKFGSSSMNFPASISSHFTPSSAGNNAKVTHSSRPGSPAMGRAVATDDVQNGGAEKDLNNSNNNGSSSKGDGHGLSTSSSTSSFVPVNKRPSLTTATTHSAGTNGVGSGRGGHEYASMSGSYQHLNGSVSPPRSNSDSYSGSVPMDEDGNPLHPQHRHTLPGYHHQTPQHHGGGYGDYDHMGGYPPSPRMHHHSSGSAPSSSFYPSGQQYSGPSSSSMNGYHNHPQFPAYHPQQYSMEDPASYHLHAHHPHGMPPMSATASSHLQQQPQPPQQQHQRSNNAVGGGRVRGMTSSAKNHCCPAMGCSKRFKRLEHLKRHTKTHTLERPFVCSTAGCNKRFSRSDNLSQHIKTHQRQLMNKIHWKQRSM